MVEGTPVLDQIENREAIAQAQGRLAEQLGEALDDRGKLRVGFPGGNGVVPIHAAGPGRLWFSPGNGTGELYWNAFGVFDEVASQQVITIEINVPVDGINRRVGGFFARETETGDIYVMRGGRPGGGMKGVGRAAFLGDATPDLVDVRTSDRRNREGIVVARLGDRGPVRDLWRFVQTVAAFKDKVRADGVAPATVRRQTEARERYEREFSGWKALPASGATEYLTRHGDVVHALREEREQRLRPGEVVCNSSLIDLLVKRGDEVTEVYEVKPRATRQDLYTAPGQLLVHAPSDRTDRILVIPKGDWLPQDMLAAIERTGVRVRRFSFDRGGAIRLHDAGGRA